ncbi:MAG: type II toxin-antitoxin system RelE/ParE family toxin [Planctomycetia bacterium]|nr:type II toxin-antitoxin system RelE/ParE family toxin [Planctomycetia bacterium]
MPGYAIEFLASADRALRRLPVTIQRRIIAAVDRLADNPRPRGSAKLAGEEDAWRIRVGEYRVLYEIEDDRLVVLVVRVGHRKDLYRRGG